jgi:hypothetical protein
VNLRETAEVLGYLSAAFPKYEMFEETVNVWSDQFSDTNFEAAQRAAKNVVASDQWFPSVARFREVLAVEVRFKTPDGCGGCENGIFLLPDGSAEFCKVCRPAQHVHSGGRRRELPVSASDWAEGLKAARERLEAS